MDLDTTLRIMNTLANIASTALIAAVYLTIVKNKKR